MKNIKFIIISLIVLAVYTIGCGNDPSKATYHWVADPHWVIIPSDAGANIYDAGTDAPQD